MFSTYLLLRDVSPRVEHTNVKVHVWDQSRPIRGLGVPLPNVKVADIVVGCEGAESIWYEAIVVAVEMVADPLPRAPTTRRGSLHVIHDVPSIVGRKTTAQIRLIFSA